MNSQTSRQLPGGGKAVQRGMKLLPALGALLLIGLSLFASQAALQPGKDIDQPKKEEKADKVPAYTMKAVEAADKFLQGLDEKQRAKVVFDFNSAKRPSWSNLPVTFVPRNGARLGDLTKEQRTAAMKVVASVVSKEGYQKILDIIAGDDELVTGKGKGPNKMSFGNDNFYLAIFGKPSPTQPWLVQFGGHHLAVNVTVVGKDFVLTPTLTCAQPSSFTKDGKTIRPLGVEVDTAFKLLKSLDEKQSAQAILKTKTRDLLLGPGNDGKQPPAPDGIKGSELDDKQQAILMDLIGAWVNILQEESAVVKMAEIKAGLKDTYFGWSGPTADGSAAYFRVQGPTIVIEYAPQGGTNHIHTIVREPGNDYGKKLIKG